MTLRGLHGSLALVSIVVPCFGLPYKMLTIERVNQARNYNGDFRYARTYQSPSDTDKATRAPESATTATTACEKF